MKPFRISAFVSIAALALTASLSASAQDPPDQTCLFGGQQSQGVAQIATSCPIGRAPALQAFRFGFFNGDHKIRHIELMPNGETFEAAYEDVGGEDQWFVEGRWLRVPEAQGGIVTAVARGLTDITIPAGPPGTTLVLSGFEFRRADGTDNNIRTIGITLDTAAHTIRTAFLDDEGADYSWLPGAIAYGFAIGAPGTPTPNMPIMATGGLPESLMRRGSQRLQLGIPLITEVPPERPFRLSAEAARNLGRNSGILTGPIRIDPSATPATTTPAPTPPAPRVTTARRNARPYQVTVAYLWVPNSHLANSRLITSGGRALSEVSGRLPAGAHVIQSFSLSFMNSDHYLEGFGVHLNGGAPFRTSVAAGEAISYNDADRGDPISWSVRLADFH